MKSANIRKDEYSWKCIWVKNVVMKHMNPQMVNYIGLKIGKIMKKKLDLYCFLFVYLDIRNERKIVN